MKLAAISVSGFRGFTNEVVVNLEADFVLLTGANGAGKTSFMDAILWCITGHIPRLEAVSLKKKREDYVSNKYAATVPHVELTFKESGEATTVSRRGVGKDQRLVVVPSTGDPLAEDEANLWLQQHFNPVASEGKGFQRAFVLQQDDIREFLNADPGERYRYLSYLAGVEDAETLDRQLKNELKKLKDANREIANQLSAEESRLSALETSREESVALVERADLQETTRQSAILDELRTLLPRDVADISPSSTAEELVQVAREHAVLVEGKLSELTRRTQALKAAEDLIASTQHDPEAVETLAAQVATAESLLQNLELRATTLDQEARDAAVLEDRRKQLASLALDQLEGNRCPVCDQEFDHDHALAHLRSILDVEPRSAELRREADELRKRASAESQALVELRQKVSQQEQIAQSLARAIATAEAEREAQNRLQMEINRLLPSSESDANEQLAALRRAVQSAATFADAVKQHRSVRRQLEQIDTGLKSQREAVAALATRRRQLADRVSRADGTCSWLGDRLVEATGKVLSAATPLINELYARLDIHPTLRRFDFHAERHYEAGRVVPWLFDDEAGIEGNAGHLLSSAQLNVLAVCLFMSMNLIQRWSSLEVAVMDDPVQSMDDVHVLGLADTIRGARDRRQIIVSTHDSRVAELFWRKLRPRESHHRNLRIEFTDWAPTDGPSIKLEERIGTEPEPLGVIGSVSLHPDSAAESI